MAIGGEREAGRAETEALITENERLRERVHEQERLLAERAVREEQQREEIAVYRSILENSPLMIYAKDTDGRYLIANDRAAGFVGLTGEQLKGKTDYDILPKDLADTYRASDREVMASDKAHEREDTFQLPEGESYYITTKFSIRDSMGQVCGVCSVSTDITSVRRAEQENRRLQDEIIRVQEVSLRALSTPLLPIAEGVVVMPLIGNVDRTRAQRVLETLLDGIVAHAASSVILDVTGVPVVDTEVASALVKTAQAVKLLGAEVILTGIQPRIAQTLIAMGADLSNIVTEGTLQNGIARALKRPGLPG
jgi:PAS domain S-box-containing protein